MTAGSTHLVLIPSYNTGAAVLRTVRDARRWWPHVWVVVDGSTDGSAAALHDLAAGDSGLRVLVLPRNRGKGAAILHGIERAAAAGFTHVLTLDADGQHPTDRIPDFIAESARRPEAMVLGRPVFDASAPCARVYGRRLSNGCAWLETGGRLTGDSLFGFRVYPIHPLLDVMRATRWMRGYDFDAEAAVRLCWAGVCPVDRPAPVRYFRPEEGGVSHYRYGRSNLLLSWMHIRLLAGAVARAFTQRPDRRPAADH